jgi:hypothetical protein
VEGREPVEIGLERPANGTKDGVDIALDDPSLESESAYAEGGEASVASGVVGGMRGVGSAVDLDGEGAGGGKEVDDEAVEGDLPSEAYAEGGTA